MSKTFDLTQLRTLVLNADYRPLATHPLSTWSWEDAIKQAVLNRVLIVEQYEHVVHSQSIVMQVPSVVAVRKYVSPSRTAAFTRHNLFLRDRYRCQYCDRQFSRSGLTFDHVKPASRGGPTSWENIVAACHDCNFSKGDKTLPQSGLVLKRLPRAPSQAELDAIGREFISDSVPESWSNYLFYS